MNASTQLTHRSSRTNAVLCVDLQLTDDSNNDKKMSETNSLGQETVDGEMFGTRKKGLERVIKDVWLSLPIKLDLMAFKRFINLLQSTPMA